MSDLELPDIGDPTLQAEAEMDIVLIKWILGLGLGLFIVWIIAMMMLP